jgi:hypothetical protein
MLRFRARRAADPTIGVSQADTSFDAVRQVLTEALLPGHFYVAPGHCLEWQHVAHEEILWEVFHGRLLDPAHTRQRQVFESWNVFRLDGSKRSAEPILSVKLDVAGRQVHVTRALYCHAWEGYHAGGNIYLSRPTQKWVRELVGSVDLNRFADRDSLQDEIIALLFQAAVGGSRLPLTSVEAPLPDFTLGTLGYFHRPRLGSGAAGRPMPSFRELIASGLHEDLSELERAKLLEAVLRSTMAEEIREAAALFLDRWSQRGHGVAELVALYRRLFNEVALSPYTNFVDQALAFLRSLTNGGRLPLETYIDFLSYLLRQNARHLTAYDLVTFHHSGANYPDALLLDTVLRAYLEFVEHQPQWFLNSPGDDRVRQDRKRLRGRALRQGWLIWHALVGLPVPDAPTSPGENARVLPPPHVHVPEEQILNPARRTKQLFAGTPLPPLGENAVAMLRQSAADLQHPEEVRELGMAVFLDRPLGAFKAPGEPDRTPLLSYEAFSRSLAEQRLQMISKRLALAPSQDQLAVARQVLREEASRAGIALQATGRHPRPGAVSLDDAVRVAKDFVLLRTTRQTVREFLELFDFSVLAGQFKVAFLHAGQRVLIVSAASVAGGEEGTLLVYDDQLRRRLELEVDRSLGYLSRAGRDYPAAGLRVLRVWESAGEDSKLHEYDLRPEGRTVPVRSV